MNYHQPLFVLSICSFIYQANGYNILGIFPHSGESHLRFFLPIMRALAEQGHNVTVSSFFPDKNPYPNYKHLAIGEPLFVEHPLSISVLGFLSRRTIPYALTEYAGLKVWGYQTCQVLFNSTAMDEIFEIHKRNPFDLGISEIFNTDCTLAVFHKLNVPYISASSCALAPYHLSRMGIPDTPSYIPTEYLPHSDKMTFCERIKNFVFHYMLRILESVFSLTDDIVIKSRFGSDIPPINQLMKNTSLIFLNSHYSFNGPRPLPPNVVDIGGIHIEEPKPLSNDLQSVFDSAKDGVVLISWGSMARASTLPVHIRDAIRNAVRKFPQTFIWKWDSDTMENQPDNVVLKKWLPQKDILCHKNVKAFITHGGLLGSIEAVHCGVPVVVTPLFGDQLLNAKAFEDRKTGVIVRYYDLTEDTITKALEQVFTDEYSNNAKELAEVYNNRLVDPKKTAVWWAEHVIKTKGNRLAKTYASELNWFIFYSFDVIFILIIGSLLLIYCLKKINQFLKKKTNKKSQAKNVTKEE